MAGRMGKEPMPTKMTVAEMERGIRRLERRLRMVEEFNPEQLNRADPYSSIRPLEAEIETALSETFGHETKEYSRFRSAARFDWPIFVGREIPHQQKVESVTKHKLRSTQLLAAAIEMLRERIVDQEPGVEATTPAAAKEYVSNKIFVVHGHDNEVKETMARFLTSVGFEPVILHEQANRGRTIIQKFQEEAADVGFAVVLMTPDDEMPDGRKRARQNVVLELGFFLGALGPDRVAAIVKGDVERPSDFDGVVYITFDGGWKAAVGRELQAAGYDIDWNIVMR